MIAESLICLALNVYHEAKNQSFIGQVAVAQVVMNRVKDNRYPNNVCDVVKQGLTYKWKPSLPIKNRCQFSWYCDGLSDEPKDDLAWEKSLMVAHGVLSGYTENVAEDALWYHAHYVNPDWASSKRFVVRINDHIFYAKK
jgi:spore germination cell wall hydrolase CwlJ-like protein